MTRTGAALVVETLVAHRVTHLFSLSGNQILTLYDATVDRPIAIVHTRHEAAAVHMADAWGRVMDRPGVAVVTAGPGHCNALGALYTALMAESPVVLLSGHAALSQLGRGAFQEMDQVALARPVAKASWLATDPERVGDVVAAALTLAGTGRPGPVHVSLPNDVLDTVVRASPTHPGDEASVAAEEGAVPRGSAGQGRVAEILERLAAASRPLILVGPAMGRRPRWTPVEQLAARTGIPALLIESPRGINDPWLHAASASLGEADVLLLLGKRLDYSLRFGEPPALAPGARVLVVDADSVPAPTAKRADLVVQADPAHVAECLLAGALARDWHHHAWGAAVAAARRHMPPAWATIRRERRTPIHPLLVADALQPVLDGRGVLVADGGEFGQWMQAGLEAELRLINGLGGSIGSALPMGCAVKLARPDRPVLVTVGDGTFGFHPTELDTALRYGLPIVVVVGNDARWNAEYQLQLRHYGADRLVGCELRHARYDLLAAALGGHGELVERPDALRPALDRAIASGRPACLNVVIEGAAAPTYGGPPGH